MKDTIGLNRVPGLWNLGSPYINGVFPDCKSSGTIFPVIYPSFSIPVTWSLPCTPEPERDLSSTYSMCWYHLTFPVASVHIHLGQ